MLAGRPLLRADAAQRYVDAFLSMRGVVGLWPLWEMNAMGTTFRALGPTQLVGTKTGTMTPTSLPGSVADRGLLGNGSTGYVVTPHDAVMNLADVWSATAIVMPGAAGAWRSIVSKGQGAFYFRLDNTNNLNIVRSQLADVVHSTVAVPLGGAHHVAATKTGATVKLYIEGRDVTGTVTNSTMVNNGQAFNIGIDENNVGAKSEYTNARLAMVGLHNRAITQAEVAMLAAIASGQ